MRAGLSLLFFVLGIGLSYLSYTYAYHYTGFSCSHRTQQCDYTEIDRWHNATLSVSFSQIREVKVTEEIKEHRRKNRRIKTYSYYVDVFTDKGLIRLPYRSSSSIEIVHEYKQDVDTFFANTASSDFVQEQDARTRSYVMTGIFALIGLVALFFLLDEIVYLLFKSQGNPYEDQTPFP